MEYGAVKYMHVEKFGSDEVDGIEKCESYVLPKIDGTNGVMWLEDGKIHCGSRKRELSADSDNAGFFAKFHDDERFKLLFEEYPHFIIYGEFLVKNVIKDYKDTAWRKFYVFDVKSGDRWLTPDEYIPILAEYGIDYIPVMCKIKNPTMDQLKDLCEKASFLMKDDKPGEGIVLHAPGYVNKFGRVVWAKVVRSEFKAVKHAGKKVEMNGVESAMVDKYFTSALINKEYAKIVNEMGGWKSEYIPRFLGTVYHAFITECAWDMVKKNPTINFSVLHRLCTEKAKEVMSSVF